MDKKDNSSAWGWVVALVILIGALLIFDPWKNDVVGAVVDTANTSQPTTPSHEKSSRTKINQDSYKVFALSATKGCLNGSEDPSKKVFCVCAASALVGNQMMITQKYHLEYEDEWPAHMAEVSLTKSQANICLAKR